MPKKSILVLIILSLTSIVIAQEVVATRSSFSPVFYIAIFLIIVVVGLVVFFIKKLKYGLNQILKSVGISLLITSCIEILFYLIGSLLGFFRVYCKPGGHCPGPFEIFLEYLPYTATLIFLLTILIYYITKFIKNK